MIRCHVVGMKEMISGEVLDHTYSFYEESHMEDMRVVEHFLDKGKILHDPQFYRESVLVVDSSLSNSPPIEVYVDGKTHNPRDYARRLYKMLLEIGFTPYTS